MNPQSSSAIENRRKKKLLVLAAVVPLLIVVLVVGTVMIAGKLRSDTKAAAEAQTKCLSKELSQGSSGDCVHDVQAMVNFMETDGLTQCPFTGGFRLPLNGYYDASTSQQVAVVQDWLTCYNKQEGLKIPDFKRGKVTAATWSQLCTYAYQYPSQSNDSKSNYRTEALAAGKDAGCANP